MSQVNKTTRPACAQRPRSEVTTPLHHPGRSVGQEETCIHRWRIQQQRRHRAVAVAARQVRGTYVPGDVSRPTLASNGFGAACTGMHCDHATHVRAHPTAAADSAVRAVMRCSVVDARRARAKLASVSGRWPKIRFRVVTRRQQPPGGVRRRRVPPPSGARHKQHAATHD